MPPSRPSAVLPPASPSATPRQVRFLRPAEAESEGGPLRRGRANAARPRLRLKSKGGAPRGNRNAQKSGCHTRAFREFNRALRFYVRLVKAQLAPLRAALPRPQRRIFYEIVRPERCYVRTRRSGRAPQRVIERQPVAEMGNNPVDVGRIDRQGQPQSVGTVAPIDDTPMLVGPGEPCPVRGIELQPIQGLAGGERSLDACEQFGQAVAGERGNRHHAAALAPRQQSPPVLGVEQ